MRLEFRFNELDIFQEDENKRADLLSKLTMAGLPIEVALELAGYKLTDEQAAMLESHQEQLDDRIDETPVDERTTELRKWQKFAEKRVKEGKELREFESSVIEPSMHGAISGALEGAKSVEEVRHIFDSVITWRGYP